MKLFRPIWAIVLLNTFTCILAANDFSSQAAVMRAELASKVLPYWFDTAQDTRHGGYLLADDAVQGRGQATEKQLVSQARMIWTFSHVHRKGFTTQQRNYLHAAEQGYHFLRHHFLDPVHGGYYWKTNLDGTVCSEIKNLYAQAFVIYGLVEYHRASGKPEPLAQALGLYRLLQSHAHDAVHGGWFEHFTRDWRLIRERQPGADIEVPGFKSANAHLHLMEALTELYDASRDPDVRKSLEESITLNSTYFYPLAPGQSCFHRHPDWSTVEDPKSAGVSYGHNVEFAWLLIRAQEVLGVPPNWDHFTAHVDHALLFGFDHERGGLAYLGYGDQPATRTDKEWWVQAEMIAALAEGLQHHPELPYVTSLTKLLRFIWTCQTDPRDGVWLATVTWEGQPKNTAKAHNWKANYHDVRAMVKFAETFGSAGR